MVQLLPVTPDNIDEVLSFRVLPEQEAFVSSNAHSLAQAYAYRKTAYPFAVYNNDTPVGFLMLGYYEARKQYTLWKFMINHRWQQQGIGRRALELGVAFLKDQLDAKEIYTGVVPENTAAARLYEQLGFRETGLYENGMKEMKLASEPCAETQNNIRKEVSAFEKPVSGILLPPGLRASEKHHASAAR